MKRLILPIVVALVGFLVCASGTQATTLPPVSGVGTPSCVPPKDGYMGACIAHRFALNPKSVGAGLGGTQGVDLSSNNGAVSGNYLRANGIRFAYLKADQAGGRDSQFLRNTASLRAADIPTGAYDFVLSYAISPANDMRAFAATIKAAGINKLTLPPVLDVETELGGSICLWVDDAEDDLRVDLGWKTVGVYTSPGLWPGCSGNEAFSWPADWGASAPYAPRGFADLKVWQWSGGPDQDYTNNELYYMDRDRDYGVVALHYQPPKPKPKPPSRKKAKELIAYWAKERAAVLHIYHVRDCQPSSRGPKCVAWRNQEHALLLDINRTRKYA